MTTIIAILLALAAFVSGLIFWFGQGYGERGAVRDGLIGFILALGFLGLLLK